MSGEKTSVEIGVLHELEPVVEKQLNRHLRIAKEWHPHDYIPWSRGRDFARLGGEDWDPSQSSLDPVAQKALIVNLLTEDNLPSYHRTIAETFGRDGAWGQWVGRWTAEEGRHGIAIRDYSVATRGVDPVELERLRMTHMTVGYDAGDRSPLDTVAYVTMQEMATRISHRNTGAHCAKGPNGDTVAEQLLTRISIDENLHMVFYRALANAAFEIAPNEMMMALMRQTESFAMPGKDIPGFGRAAVDMAYAGIYNSRIHLDEVVSPALRFWKVFSREDLTGKGAEARDNLARFMTRLETEATRFDAKLERKNSQAAAKAS